MRKIIALNFLLIFFSSTIIPQEFNFQLDVITHMNTTSELQIENNTLYAATTGGLLIHNLTTHKRDKFTSADGMFDHHLTAINRSEKHSKLILGSITGNLSFFDLESQNVTNDANLEGNEVVDIISIEDTLWVLTNEFVSVYLFTTDLQRFQFRESYREFGVNTDELYAVEWANNRIWIGSDKGVIHAPSDFLKNNLYASGNWDLINDQAGLPGNNVFELVWADQQGLLYLATNQGLAIYDFTQFTTITDGLISRRLADISLQGGQLFASDTRRIYQLHDNQFVVLHELNNLRASDLAVNSNKDTWIAVERRGLHNITTGQEIVVDGPMDNYIGEMLIDSRGYLWCTTGLPKDERKQGVYVRTDEGWINYLFSGGNGNRYRNFNSTLAVFEDAEQNIWIGSWGGGLLVFDQEFNMHPINPMSDSGSVWINSINNDDTVRVQTSSELQGIISSVDNDPFYSVITDFILDFKTQSIWLSNLAAKNRRSLIQYKGVAFTDAALLESAWESYSNPSGNDQWFEMTQDPFGDIWLASGGAGVIQARLEDNILKTAKYSESDNLKSNATTSIAADEDGYIWVGTRSGLSAILNGTVFDFRETYQPIGLKINDIFVDSRGNKWFATDRGLSVLKSAGSPFDPQSWVDVVPLNSSISPEQLALRANVFKENLPSENIHNVFLEEKSGDIYATTDEGVAIFHNNPFTSTFENFDLLKVGPNPFILNENGSNMLRFYNLVPESQVKILTANGQLIRTLNPDNFNEVKGGVAEWDGRNLDGRLVSTGVYLYLITNQEGQQKAGKVMVVKE